MLVTFFINILAGVVGVALAWLPTVVALPFDIDTNMVTAVGYWNAFLSYFWFFQTPWQCFLWYIGIKSGLIVARFFLGARVPTIS